MIIFLLIISILINTALYVELQKINEQLALARRKNLTKAVQERIKEDQNDCNI